MTENEREEILSKSKPILFNTDMVRAILDGRKTVTRRVIKPYEHIPKDAVFGYTAFTPEGHISARGGFTGEKREERYGENFIKMPYLPGNILYVRETWGTYSVCEGIMPTIYYKADGNAPDKIKWKPSIHMPKEAARIFLRVTNVRVERLQDMTEEDAYEEGWSKPWCAHKVFDNYPDSPIPCEVAGNPSCPIDPPCNHSVPELFGADIWDKTIKKSDLDRYGWDANPWCWVIEFERID